MLSVFVLGCRYALAYYTQLKSCITFGSEVTKIATKSFCFIWCLLTNCYSCFTIGKKQDYTKHAHPKFPFLTVMFESGRKIKILMKMTTKGFLNSTKGRYITSLRVSSFLLLSKGKKNDLQWKDVQSSFYGYNNTWSNWDLIEFWIWQDCMSKNILFLFF